MSSQAQVVPIQQLHTIGLIKDTPSIALPPNAFSDVLNVRFNNGCINKIEGEHKLFSSYTGNSIVGDIVHIAYWENPNLSPNDAYYLVVATNNQLDKVYVIRASDGYVHDLDVEIPSGGQWQHTVYQGGYSIIVNNGQARPMYILDTTGNTDITNLEMYDLPGWDSYYTNETSFDDIFNPDTSTPEFDLGRAVDFELEEVIISVYSSEDSELKFTVNMDSVTTIDQVTLSFDERTNTHVVTIATEAGGMPPFETFLESGDNVVVNIRSLSTVQVRCGVVRAWGDTLVAGNLKEITAPRVESVTQSTNTITMAAKHGLEAGDVLYIQQPEVAKGIYTIASVNSLDVVVSGLPVGDYSDTQYTIVSSGNTIRNQVGVVRISDVAAPGGIPHNWNPYVAGVSTADEFVLATTGVVQDLVPMQGNLYIYTNNSIHVIQKTSSTSTPYIADTVSDTHGALGVDAVQEFKGTHLVVGSNDIYQFSGHSASITSVADSRVRDYFYNNLNSDYSKKLFMVLNTAQDEMWLCFSNLSSSGLINEMLIFNYGLNVWSKRIVTDVNYGISANTKDLLSNGQLSTNVNQDRTRPVFVSGQDIFGCDYIHSYVDKDGNSYESYIERLESPMTPEFDVEYLSSIALWASKNPSNDDTVLKLRFRGTDNPADSVVSLDSDSTMGSQNVSFKIGDQYKSDIRINSRFINFRVTDEANATDYWKLTGMQLEVKKGGRR